MVVQSMKDHPNLVNILLKPLERIQWEYDYIAYFIFRGIKKSSLIQLEEINGVDTEIVSKSFVDRMPPDLNPVDIKKIIDRDKKKIEELWNTTGDSASNHVLASYLGYDYDPDTNSYLNPDGLSIGKYMESDNEYNEIQLPIANAGMIIGEFVGQSDSIAGFTHLDAGFEIVGERIGYEYTLGNLRKSENILDVSSITNLGLDELARQEILHYFDPSSFYGNLLRDVKEVGINKEIDGFISNEPLTRSLTDKFKTSNLIYIDIRHETGFSYDYFKEYNHSRNPIALIAKGSSMSLVKTVDIIYEKNWPIHTINYLANSNSSLIRNALQNESVTLDENNKLYFIELHLGFSRLNAVLQKYQATTREDGALFNRNLLTVSKKRKEGSDTKIVSKEIEEFDYSIPIKIFLQNYNAGDPSTIKPENFVGGYTMLRLGFDLRNNEENIRLTTDGSGDSINEGLLERNAHPLDLTFPIFDMVEGIKFQDNIVRTEVRVYSPSNSGKAKNTSATYTNQSFLPSIGVARDATNYTFFIYSNSVDIIYSSLNELTIQKELPSNFTILHPNFLVALTTQDIKMSLRKKTDRAKLKEIVNGEVEEVINDIVTFSFVGDQVRTATTRMLNADLFDSISISKTQYDQLKDLKEDHFSTEKYPVFLGVIKRAFRKASSESGIIYQLELTLKGFAKEVPNQTEPISITRKSGIFVYGKVK